MTQAPVGSRAALALRTSATVTLDRSQQRLVAEALRRAAQARVTVEGAPVEFGRWILTNVFANDPEAALSARRENPVWCELLARAGGRSLRFGRHMLSVALHIAARDRLIDDRAWRMLEPGRKGLLLALRDDEAMRRAARHVVAAGLTQRETRAYVRALRAKGHPPREAAVRMTPRRAGALVFRAARDLIERKTLERMCAQLGQLGGEERDETHKTLLALRSALDDIERALGVPGARAPRAPRSAKTRRAQKTSSARRKT